MSKGKRITRRNEISRRRSRFSKLDRAQRRQAVRHAKG